MNIEIQKMKQEHVEQIQDILLIDFDEFWNAGVLKNELENPLSIYIVALNQGEVDDTVVRGQIIGMSGTCKLYSTDSNLHFELSHQGKNVNPEEYYNKSTDEL